METHKVLETENTEEKTNKQTARARARALRAPNARARCAAILLAGGRRPIFTLQLRKNGRVVLIDPFVEFFVIGVLQVVLGLLVIAGTRNFSSKS